MRRTLEEIASNKPKPKPEGGGPVSDGPKKPDPVPTGGEGKK